MRCFAIILLVWLLASWAAVASAQPTASDDNDLFGPTKIWSIELQIPSREFDSMQPPPPGQFGAPPAPPVPPAAGGARESERSLFGTEFRWAQADFTAEGQTLKKIGIRYAGDITYLVSAGGLKRPLKLSFNKFEAQTFGGLSAVQLHAMPLDPSKAREALAYLIFRACIVPAQRTAFAEVTLTVKGRHDREYLGLFTVVEDVDAPFLKRNFGADDGLVMKPFRVRGIDFLGENWDAYKGQYRPQRDANLEEQQRVIAFAKLVNSASNEEFEKQISSFIDVDEFLRFMAANALTANLESFFALGHNYNLYLDLQSKQFHFIPGDLEFSFANLMLFGTGEQLMDLSLMKPYPGDNKLPDRLLAIKSIAERYRQYLQAFSLTVFTSDIILRDAEAIDRATNAVRDKEQEAVAARPAPAPAFGPPVGAGPQPPDLKTFAEMRTKSIREQLKGDSKGYVPRPFSFGPPSNAGNDQPINEVSFRENVKVPAEFEATLFAVPPQVNYPVAIACEPIGAVYVAVDEQGSLGRTPGGGRILRCVDRDDDGKVDDVTIFAKVEHPRGVTYRNGKVWVMHPPDLSVFQDVDGDGVAESQEVLVTGLTTDQITNRGGDHTTNCVRMGIDGWLYIGVGDYGIKEANGKDGRKIVLRGGGVVRVRPDGTELEIFCTGLRNPFDLAIDPFLNIFTRDNTNDGAGWDTRVSLLKQSALYGYTQLFANFTDEIMPTLGTFGNSGGTGGLYIQDHRWPAPFQNTLLTGDWGRSEVYRHQLTPNGPTFDLKQEVFVQIPRATGMDIDGKGRLYVASWRGGEAAVFVGPNIGFVARVTPKNLVAEPFPDLKQASFDDLLKYLAAPESVMRLHAQGEILARGRNIERTQSIIALATDEMASLEARVAAIFTLKQLDGKDANGALTKLTAIPAIREFALRALTDRESELEGLNLNLFVDALKDPTPRIKAQALISLGRLNKPASATSILPLTLREPGSVMPSQRPLQNQPDQGRVVPHLAVRALAKLHAVDTCLEALEGPYAEGALWTLRYEHSQKAVEGLIKRLATARTQELRRGILVTLIRLYNREADYEGSWWGIRPDNTGPYFDRVQWEMSPRIASVLTTAINDSDRDTVAYLKRELLRHSVTIPGIANESETATKEPDIKVVIPKADPTNPKQIGNLNSDDAATRTLAIKGDAKKGELLFKAQSCVACHTTADGQTPKGPHLFEIGRRYKAAELVESILKPSAKLAQGYETYQFLTVNGLVIQGFVVSERADGTVIRESDGRQREIKKVDVEERRILKISAMPEGLVANLTSEQLADVIAYLQSLKADQPPGVVTLTTQEDHQNMQRQLGITKLRPGPNGNESAPNHANYDEALANPYPQLPELLVCRDGTSVKTKEDWLTKRRPEIAELFEQEVIGRIPADTPNVTWKVVEEQEITVGEIPVIERTVEGVVDNSRCREIEVRFSIRVGLPKNTGKVPVLIMFSGFGFGGRGGPPPSGLRTAGPTREKVLTSAGWGYVLLNPTDVQPDNGAGLTRGIIGMTNLGQPRKPDDWGALRAWGWGASRVLDYLETDSAVDTLRIGIEGVSRYGKAALVTMAFDERFDVALVASSGEGGAKLHRRNFGEAVENLTGSGEYHWMAGNFLKYGAEEAGFGSKNAGDIPVDAHQLIALCAPRLVFISYGIPEKGDAKWLDQQGSYMATVAAQPAYRLLGVETLGVSDDYANEKMPAVNFGLLKGSLAWRQHDGGHTSSPNLSHFLEWANKKFQESFPTTTR